MVRVRSRVFTASLLCLAASLALCLYHGNPTPRAQTIAADGAETLLNKSLVSYCPLYSLIKAGHDSYPLGLMFGFICRGNVELRKACGGSPYPNWILGFLLGFVCYVYPANVMTDTMMCPGVLRAMSMNKITMVHTFWYTCIQGSEWVYKQLLNKHVNILITVWFIMDATHASLVFLERAVSPPFGTPTFSRALWECFIWCSASAILGSVEKLIRGVEKPKLDVLIPNSADALGHPIICMFFGMVLYLLYMMFATDCGVFQEGGKSLFECGMEHQDLYVMFHYVPMGLHLVRAYRPAAPMKK